LLSYRSLAESWRVMATYKLRNRGEIVANNLRAAPGDAWSVISFFYPMSYHNDRLSDEDLREIYFLLTGAFPEEIEKNADPIQQLTMLSETPSTTGSARSVSDRISKILEADDNEVRSWLIRPLFERINSRDLHPFFMRLSVRSAPVRRRDVISALALAYEQPYHHIRTSVNLLGLRNTLNDLSLYSFDYTKVRPILGESMVIPTPTLVESSNVVAFTKCLLETVEGAWVTIHRMQNKTIGFTASGNELPDDDDWIHNWANIINLQEGIYLCDYAEMRDNPLLLVDWLNPDDPKMTLAKRRDRFNGISEWAIKPMIALDRPYDSEKYQDTGLPFLIRNARGILTYQNTVEEVVLLNPVSKHRILRVLSGRVHQNLSQSDTLFVLWKLGVRDGYDYFPIVEMPSGELEDIDFKQYCSPWKWLPGEAIKIDNPLFVKVDIMTSGWGEVGAYVNGRIVGIDGSAGIADTMGVEEIGYVGDSQSG